MLVGPEVRIVQHSIRIDDAHHTDLVEVQALRNHLRANENVSPSGGKVRDDALVGIPRTGGVEVHAGDMGFGKDFAHLLLYLLRAVAARPEVCRFTARALCRNTVRETAVVAGQLVQLAVVGQRYVTVLAGGHPTTLAALDDRGKATAVLEQNGLFAVFQCFAYLI